MYMYMYMYMYCTWIYFSKPLRLFSKYVYFSKLLRLLWILVCYVACAASFCSSPLSVHCGALCTACASASTGILFTECMSTAEKDSRRNFQPIMLQAATIQ